MTSENCPCWTICAHLSVFCVNSTEFGGQVLFIATSCWEKGLFFITAGYCFLQLWVLLLERSIRRAEGGVDSTNLCCTSASEGGSSVQRPLPKKGLAELCGMQVSSLLWICLTQRRPHKCSQGLCAKALTWSNSSTNAQSKTCTLLHIWTARQCSWWPKWFVSSICYSAYSAKLSCHHLIELMTAAFLDVSDDPNLLCWKMI